MINVGRPHCAITFRQSNAESQIVEAPDEEAEDRILEALDFAVGFCSPQMSVWPD